MIKLMPSADLKACLSQCPSLKASNSPYKVGMYFDMDKREVTYFGKSNNNSFYEGFKIGYLPRDIRIAINDP